MWSYYTQNNTYKIILNTWKNKYQNSAKRNCSKLIYNCHCRCNLWTLSKGGAPNKSHLGIVSSIMSGRGRETSVKWSATKVIRRKWTARVCEVCVCGVGVCVWKGSSSTRLTGLDGTSPVEVQNLLTQNADLILWRAVYYSFGVCVCVWGVGGISSAV